jgi:hypothetical protein
MEIKRVDTKKDIQHFLGLPDHIHAANSFYIRHLDKDIEAVFDRQLNNYFKTGNACRWLLFSGAKVVGRIAAFFHREKPEEPFAGIGFFDCENNQAAAFTLFDTAMQWLQSQGVKGEIMAPVNFGERDSFWGLLIDGFEEGASYKENFNPPYYQAFFEAYGFNKKIIQSTSAITRDSFNYERFSKLASRVFSNPKYSFEHMKHNQAERFAKDFVAIYNEAWKVHENYRPLTYERILKQIKQLAAIAPEELNWFVYADGKPAGFYINVLNINPIFKKSRGKFDGITKIRFLLNKSKINKIRGIVFGVIPEFHNLGLEVGMIMKFYEQVYTKKYAHIASAELAWVGDFNPKMLSMFESMGAQTVKKHITYTYNL